MATDCISSSSDGNVHLELCLLISHFTRGERGPGSMQVDRFLKMQGRGGGCAWQAEVGRRKGKRRWRRGKTLK